ncbi:unnamed protein product [Acidocella sp. C78]|nr:unnamed protein product [Acidocella sp. C78]CAG4902080.1 unnamed protein product [Acidocella sp. C78]
MGFLHGAIFEPEAVISGLEDMAVVGEAIEVLIPGSIRPGFRD